MQSYSRWEQAKNHRYYEVHFGRDLLGDWHITKVWGRKNTALGQMSIQVFNHYSAANDALVKIEKRRKKNQYQLIKRFAHVGISKKSFIKTKKDEVIIKSPLRYPGGKSKAVPQIVDNYIPRGLPTLCSPFLGGGSIELALASRSTTVYAYDAFEPLVHFWQELLQNKVELAQKVRLYK